MSKRPIIALKPKEGRRARAGAPWVFSNEIASGSKSVPPGSVVDVKFDDGQDLGSGFFNPQSLIAVRLLARAPGVLPNREFFERHLSRALRLREQFYSRPFYRLVHAEGDGLPGLVIDRFGDVLVVQVSIAGMELALEPLLAALKPLLEPAAIILRNDVAARTPEGLPSYVRAELGQAGRIAVEENGARYFADLGSGQKTGWYYDQRDNRAFIAGVARGRSVLDAYSYTGGF
ncbi:MAG TPA: class I SAM-dependent methyltransferase, partial [Rhizomicrobium sp.]